MFKTIFGKIMLLFMVIILAALVLSGLMTTRMVRNAYLNDSEQQMLSVSNDVQTLLYLYSSNSITYRQLQAQIAAKAQNNSDTIWIVDSDLQVWLTEDPSGITTVTQDEIQMYYNEMISQLKAGNTVKAITEEANIFNTPVMTVAAPVTASDGTISGYVFIHKQIYEMDLSLGAMYRQIILTAAISAALGIVLTSVFSKSMLRPLSVVTLGAKQLSKGDFDIHLKVRSKDEIGQLAETFNTVAMDLRKYEASRESLIANVSHELRSPLTSIQGLVQGALDGTIPQDEVNHYLEVVLGETKRLNFLITDMLDLAKIESGQFPMEMDHIEINELIRRVLISFESKITAKNLNVEAELSDDKVYVLADINRMTQVLHNIMENAIKFADEGGRLRIADEVKKDSVLVSVTNSGDIIPPEDIPYVFDRFYKIDKSHTRTKEGTGIGLSLVKNILKAHGQKVWVTSDAENGTTFTFTLKRV